MNRRELLIEARDQLHGLIAEAYVNSPRLDKDGPRDHELALRIRQAFKRVEEILHKLASAGIPPQEGTNGQKKTEQTGAAAK